MRLTIVGGSIGRPGPPGRTQEIAAPQPNPPVVSALRSAASPPARTEGHSRAGREPLGAR